jgi:hypothetical protein
MPCSFSLPLHFHSSSQAEAQPSGLLGVTVTVRWIPFVPCLWHVDGTADENEDR